MVVQHNLLAMNSNRMLGLTSKSQSKSTEKLSSGYRINRAADDAAGLSISEKMRRQIRGLTQASDNCQDGISLAQTREGALGEVHDMLHRINELSVKAANGTLTSVDRSYIQTEIDQIVSEVDRIGKTTTFNEIPVFDFEVPNVIPTRTVDLVKSGALTTGHLTEAYQLPSGKYAPAAKMDFSKIDSTLVQGLYDKSFTFTCSASCDEAFTFKFIDGNGSKNEATNLSGRVNHQYVIDIHGAKNGSEVLDRVFDYVKKNLPNGYTAEDGGNTLPVSHSNNMIRDKSNKAVFYLVGSGSYDTPEQAEAKWANSTSKYGAVDCTEIGHAIIKYEEKAYLDIQAGAEAGQHISISMEKMNATKLGINAVNTLTADKAQEAIDIVKEAINKISRMRSDAGAEQNRLEHTIANLDNVVENTTAAESAIRDTDMAMEMVRFSNNNILAQAGQTMLAQANQSNQGVLSLLQ